MIVNNPSGKNQTCEIHPMDISSLFLLFVISLLFWWVSSFIQFWSLWFSSNFLLEDPKTPTLTWSVEPGVPPATSLSVRILTRLLNLVCPGALRRSTKSSWDLDLTQGWNLSPCNTEQGKIWELGLVASSAKGRVMFLSILCLALQVYQLTTWDRVDALYAEHYLR